MMQSGNIRPMTSAAIPFVQTASYPVRPGNFVRPLIDGEPAFRRICEAIEAARQSVWITVAFMWAAFEMPDGRGATLDVLDRAAARGIDVRLIFWRPDAETSWLRRNAFWGSATHIDLLDGRRSGVKIRWDRAHPGFCQHQKSWVIDADTENETAFVGGINLNPHSMVAPGHNGEGQNHDVYVELAGPSVVDVQHNFVQRWNEASERGADDGHWGTGSEANLPFPGRFPSSAAAQSCRYNEPSIQNAISTATQRLREDRSTSLRVSNQSSTSIARPSVLRAARSIWKTSTSMYLKLWIAFIRRSNAAWM
jgi:cardiolipin synthase A/B